MRGRQKESRRRSESEKDTRSEEANAELAAKEEASERGREVGAKEEASERGKARRNKNV